MSRVLLLTMPEKAIGSGHSLRLHQLALALKRHQVTVAKWLLGGEAIPPFSGYRVVLLDCRDSAFPDWALKSRATKIALDNRGPGRLQADIAYDALPHFAMSDSEYSRALSAVLLHPWLTQKPPRVSDANFVWCHSAEEAYAAAGWHKLQRRLSPLQFLQHLADCAAVPCYFGQTLFEACYLGKKIALYAFSDYHQQLAQDFLHRLEKSPNILSALDGQGLNRLCQLILKQL